jgi:predicted nucleic acid-binding protein
MLLLDTNVISEPIKPEPNPAVRDWLDEKAAETLYISSVTIAEMIFGIGAQPPLLMLTATIRSRRQRHRGAQTEASLDELAYSISRTAKVLGVGTTTI